MQNFNYKKFIGGLTDVKSTTDWAKDIVQLFNVRKLIVYFIIIVLIAGIFYWKGLKETPVEIGTDLIAYDKTFTLRLDPKEIAKYQDPGLIKPINSRLLHYGDWRKDLLGESIRLEDVEELRKKLKPYGWESKIIGVMGVGISPNDVSGESGAGYRYSRLWSLRTEIVATNKGFYPVSVSYKPSWIFNNTSMNVGWGKAWEDGMNRGLFAINVEF